MTDLLKTQKVFSITAGDRLPALVLLFVDHKGNPLDLTPYPDIRLVIAPKVGGRRIVDMGTVVRQAPYTAGRAIYEWGYQETDVPDEYLVQAVCSPNINLTGANLMRLTLPGGSYGKLVIVPRL